uniref:Protein Y6B3B.8 putative n=1 Tax=Albugo laibachii Nc14 TaxID=890382 RepID=F0WWP6_9STRA|nr:protein Y6B3B.8 putative [Albugo laibachii Nc14]|eukprot:CCA25872.1 protein Y6B3B.8 putative [Albugo laibachii Nc14]
MWAEANVDRRAGWDRVVFSDEEKFNLDGPDGFKYYWRDLRKEEDILSRRQSGGGSVMIWAAFSTCGQSEIARETSELRRTRETGTATTLPRDAELDLIKWINGYRLEGAPISALMLTRKSLQIASEVGVSAAAFTASWTWRKAFLRRHKLAFRMRSWHGQTSPAGISAKAAAFYSELQHRMNEFGVDVVYKAEQTSVFFEHIPTKKIEAKGTQTVWPFLIFKTTTPVKQEAAAEINANRHGFGKRLWIKMCDLQSTFAVQIYANSTAWWNAEMSVRFLEYHFGERRERQVSPIHLLCDDFSAD